MINDYIPANEYKWNDHKKKSIKILLLLNKIADLVFEVGEKNGEIICNFLELSW